MIESIKIGKRKWSVQKGDYITFDGIVYKFHTGDNRALHWKSYLKVTSIKLTDAALKKIPLGELTKVDRNSIFVKGGKVMEYVF